MAIKYNHLCLGVHKFFKNWKILSFLGDRTSHTERHKASVYQATWCPASVPLFVYVGLGHIVVTIMRLKVSAGRSLLNKFQLDLCWYSRTPLIRTLFIRIGLALPVDLSRILQNYLPLKLPVYRIKYSTVLWLIELQIRRGREV